MSTHSSRIDRLETAQMEIDARLLTTTVESTAVCVTGVLEELRARHVALGGDALLVVTGFAERLGGDGYKLIQPLEMEWTQEEVQRWRDELAVADAGITAAFGIAVEAGTILLPPHIPDERAISLVPPLHIALIRMEDVVEDIDRLFALWQERGPLNGSAVLVTGPSRTSDIEKELVLGVHGPANLIVILVE